MNLSTVQTPGLSHAMDGGFFVGWYWAVGNATMLERASGLAVILVVESGDQ